jgi:hypothetical protein
MQEAHFEELAQLIHDVVSEHRSVREEVVSLRKRFLEMHFCFDINYFDDLIQLLHKII